MEGRSNHNQDHFGVQKSETKTNLPIPRLEALILTTYSPYIYNIFIYNYYIYSCKKILNKSARDLAEK